MSEGAAAPPGRVRRALVVLAWLALLALGAALVARTPFNADLSAFLPRSPDARQRVLIEQLQSGIAARTLLIGIEGGTGAAQRAQVSKALAATLRTSGLFEQVQNGDAGDWKEVGILLFEHRYQLAPDVTPERFTAEGLRDAITDTLSMLGTPAGNAVRPLLERDPTGETQRIAEGLIPADAPRSEEGVWVSRTAPRAVLLASTRAAGADLDAQAQAIAAVRMAFDQATRPLTTGRADGNAGMAASAGQADAAGGTGESRLMPRLLLSGAPVFAVQSRDQIKGEATHLATVGGLVMGGLLLLAFASLRALALALLPVVTGVVVGTAAVGLAFGSVHGLTMGFGSTLIGESVDYAIYYLIQARGAAPGQGWRRWRDLHWPTVRLGLLTSVCGFAALVFSGFPGLAQLGVFSLAGLVAAALATRFVLPVFAPDGATGAGLRRHMAAVSRVIVQTLPRTRGLWIALGVAALGLAVWQGGRLWSGDLASMSPVPPAAQRLDAALRGDIGASDARTLVVVQGADLQGALRGAEAAGARLEPLIEAGVLSGFETVTRVLPSEAAQRARLASLPDAATLRARLAVATAGLPLAAARLEPFVADIEAARRLPPVERDALRQGPLGAIVNAMLFERPGGGWSALISLHPGARFDTARLQAALAPLPEAQVLDVKRELDDLYGRYLHEAFVQATLGALAVVALLALYLRSARRLLAVCQPLALAVLLVLGGMALGHAVLGWPGLGILHLVGLLLVVAVGSNYALFFDQLQQKKEGLIDADTLASLLLANLTTVVSFGLIALSGIPALSAIGRVVAPGALLALLLAAAFARRGGAAGRVLR